MGSAVTTLAQAVDVLTTLMNSSSNEGIRLRAAVTILKLGSDNVAGNETADAVERLERRIAEMTAHLDAIPIS